MCVGRDWAEQLITDSISILEVFDSTSSVFLLKLHLILQFDNCYPSGNLEV